MKQFFRRHLFTISIILLWVLLFITNYTPGTYLIGWDNIMPEFNIKLNLLRSIFGVWQEYRGLGVFNGIDDIANLFHTIYIAILSIAFPQSVLRYIFIYGTSLIGGIGMYILCLFITKNKRASFLSGLFYMFNIGTIQMYFAPLEVFATHFAALPWLTWAILRIFQLPNKKNILTLFILSLLFSQQGFVPTVFIVYSILIFFLLLFFLLQTKKWKTVLFILLTIFCANAFWALPYAMSGPADAKDIESAKINQFGSEEIFYRNQAKGDLLDVIEMKGFMLDTIEYDNAQNKDVFFMSNWRDHTSSILYQILYLAVFGIILFGGIIILRKKIRSCYPFLATALVCFIFLANNTPVLEQITAGIRILSPTLGEIFRFPFTKFITVFAFCLSILLCIGLTQLTHLSLSHARKRLGFPIVLLAFAFLFYPIFTGNFTSPLLHDKLPKEYLQAFQYFDTSLDPTGRTAILPMYTFWNWQYRSWGQRGSGFYWFGIPQPITEQAFDPWSGYNEQFYNELSYAINRQDKSLMFSTLKKYDIKYLFLDQYILNTLTKQPINYDSLQKFLASCNFITQKKTFGKLVIYQVNNPTSVVSTLPANVETVDPSYSYSEQDPFQTNYVQQTTSPDVVPLLPSLYTGKLQQDLEFKATEQASTITFTPLKQFPKHLNGYTLRLPSLFQSEFLIPVHIQLQGNILSFTPIYPHVFINNQEILVPQQPIDVPVPATLKPTTVMLNDTKQTVDLTKDNQTGFLLNNFQNIITLSSAKNTQGKQFTIAINNYDQQPLEYPLHTDSISSIKIVVDKISSPLAATNIIPDHLYTISTPAVTSPGSKQLSASAHVEKQTNNVTLQAQGESIELDYYKANLFHQGSYILFAKTNYTSGLPMNFYVDNPFQYRAELETRFSKSKTTNVVVLPSIENYFQGYGFHFIEKSVGQEKAMGSIASIDLYPIPENTLTHIQFVKSNTLQFASTTKTPIEFHKDNVSSYTATIPNAAGYIVLSEAYNAGWKAYKISNPRSQIFNLQTIFPFFFGKQLANHVLVDNWENGWQLTLLDTKYQIPDTIVLLFWPQYLEYIGFGIGIVFFITLLFLKRK